MEPKITPLSCDTENFCTYLQTYQGIVAGTRTGSFVTAPSTQDHRLYLNNIEQLVAEQPQTPETKMHDQYAWAAFNFLVYVIAFCLLLSFVYVGVAWLWHEFRSVSIGQENQLDRIEDVLNELEKKTSAPKGEPNAS